MKTRIPFRLALTFFTLLVFSISFSQVRKTPRDQAEAPFMQHAKSYEESSYLTKLVLKNGMTVLVNEYKAHPVVSIQILVKAGFLEEPSQNPGLSSVLGAMLQRGAVNKTTGALFQNVQALGGSWSYSIDSDFARFEIIAPAAQWKRALNVQADALLNLSLNQDAIKVESKILLDQARAALDQPAEFANEKLLQLSFNQVRMGKWDYIVNNGLDKITRESLAGFYKSAYLPSRMMLVISGDVNAGEVLNEVAPIYNKQAPESKASTPMDFSDWKSGFRYQSLQGEVQAPLLYFGFRMPGSKSEDRAALEVLQAMVGMGDGSVLSMRLRDQKKLILKQETNLSLASDFGFLQIQLQTDFKNIDACEQALLTELELLKRQDPDETEMERAFAQLERKHWIDIQNVTGRARAYADYEALGSWKRMDAYVAALREVKPSDVRRVANIYLNFDNCSLLEFLPFSSEKRNLTYESVKSTFETLMKPSAEKEQSEREKETLAAVEIPQNEGSYKFDEIRYAFQTASILRGPDLFIREDHSSPLIEMGIFFPGGRLFETKDNAGITKLMTRLISRGNEKANSSHFNRQLEVYGGQIQPIVADDYFGFSFTILSRNIEAGIAMLLDAIKKPVFDKDAIGMFKVAQLSEALGCEDSNGCFLQLMKAALYSDFPYSLDANGTEASLAAINAEALQDWYNQHLKNRKALIVAVGDSKGTSLASYFVKPLSGSRIQPAELPAEYVKPSNSGQTIERKWSGRESFVLVGLQAPPADDEDRYGVSVLRSYVAGQGNFLRDLRDQNGTAFQVQLSYQPVLRGGAFIICAASNPANEQATLDALLAHMSKIKSNPIIYRDFRSAINETVGAYWIRSQNRLSQIEDVAMNILAGKGLEEYATTPKSLQNLSQGDFGEIVQKILNMEKAVVVRRHGQSPSN
jgi:zinc protease